MTIDILCEKCLESLDKSGALYFLPPDEKGDCKKLHLCIRCNREVVNYIYGNTELQKRIEHLEDVISTVRKYGPTEFVDGVIRYLSSKPK